MVTKEEQLQAMEEISIHVKSLMEIEDGEENAIVNENPPVVASKSNGAVENAIKRLQGQIRHLRLALEDVGGIKVVPYHFLIEECLRPSFFGGLLA